MKYLYSFNSHSDFYNKGMVLEDDNVVLCKDTDINKWHGHYQHPPYDTAIEYLESTGTQWIDTGYNFRKMMTVNISMSITKSITTNSLVFGAYYDGSGTTPKVQCFVTSAQKWNTIDSANKISFSGITAGAAVTIGTRYNFSLSNTATQASDATAYLFARNNNGTARLPINGMRLYSFKMQYDGAVVLDCIPVRVGNKGYLYDKVSNRLLGNSGTGDFVLGPDIQPIEYLESTGTQYINTKLIHSVSNYEYYIDFTPSENENNTAIFGSSKSNYWDGQSWSTSNNLYIGSSTLSGKGFGRQANIRETIRLIVNGNKIIGYKNGTKYLDTTFNGTIISGYQILLFAYTLGNNNASGLCKANVHSFYIIMNNKKVFYGVPVRVGNVGYMYDKVSGQLFGNAGTGSFILGPDL